MLFRPLRASRFTASVLAALLAVASGAQAPVSNTEELITNHLNALAASDKRVAAKSRVIQGTAGFVVKRGGGGGASGSAVFFSEGHKFRLSLRFDSPDYPHDQFAYDGKETYVGAIGAAARSHLGGFFSHRAELLESGLLGGAFSTAWPLLYGSETQGRFKYVGEKKVGGRKLVRLDYLPQGSAEQALTVSLFFEPETYRHVLTVYRLEMAPGVGASPNISAQQEPNLYLLEESFSDFRAVDGINLPTRWKLRYERRVLGQGYSLMEWDLAIQTVRHNDRIDPQAFIPQIAPPK